MSRYMSCHAKKADRKVSKEEFECAGVTLDSRQMQKRKKAGCTL
jgi:hypothetical protein